MKFLRAIPLLILFLTTSVFASQYIKIPYDKINERSNLIIIGKVIEVTELPAYGNPKIEPQKIIIQVISTIRGNETAESITFNTRKNFGVNYKIGLKGVFFFHKNKDGQISLVDERGVAIFDHD